MHDHEFLCTRSRVIRRTESSLLVLFTSFSPSLPDHHQQHHHNPLLIIMESYSHRRRLRRPPTPFFISDQVKKYDFLIKSS